MNLLVKNALTLLPGDETRVCDVYVTNGKISGIDAAPAGFAADKTIDGSGRLLCPGLINAHTHIYMTALRNRADDLNFMAWLFDNVMIMESKLTDDDIYWSTQLGLMEMLRGGVTCALDMHLSPHIVPGALSDAGFRGVITRGLTGGAEDKDGGQRRINEALSEAKAFEADPLLTFMLAPHAPYTCDADYLKQIAALAKERNMGIHTHLSESLDEQKTVRERYGCTPAEYYDSCGILTENTVCAHCVCLSESDMQLMAERGVSVAHNPSSNMKLGNGFAPVAKMLKHGINVALGTDGCCSNNNQSILKEMQLAALIHKGTAQEATVLPAKRVFDMATINGARALGLSGACGEIKVGMAADMALYDLDSPGFFPLGEAKAALCYASAGLNAETVIIGGRVVMERGEFLTIDTEKVKSKIKGISDRLDEIFKK